MTTHSRYFPLIVSLPLFLQNIDLTAMATALPTMARSLHVPVLELNVVIAAYAIGLAAFLPLSAWLADRFGAKQIFCSAIAVFSLASALCGVAPTVSLLVLFRILQGLGAAMMIPVGRLILLRSVEPSKLISAMVWFTVPPTIGRLAGPLVGGAIASLTSWRWIFYVNIPFGAVTIALALIYLTEAQPIETKPATFDVLGFFMMAIGLGSFLGGMETLGKGIISSWVSFPFIALGVVLLCVYGVYSIRQREPLIDLGILRFRTFRTNIIGATPLRIGILAVPFVIPLMFQVAFKLSPLVSGLLISVSALGSLATRFVLNHAVEKLSFKRVMIVATALTALVYSSYAFFRPTTPYSVIAADLFLGGLLGSLCLVSLNSFGFDDMPRERASHATALLAMAQQVTAAVSVVLAASLLSIISSWRGGDGVHLEISDFKFTLAAAGALSAFSLFPFWKLAEYQQSEAQWALIRLHAAKNEEP